MCLQAKELMMKLLVFRVNQLGDNVVYLPVVQSLAAAHPDWSIVVVTSVTAARLYEVCCPQVGLRLYETADFMGAWRTPWKLARMAADLSDIKPDVCLLGDDQGNVAHLLALFSGAGLCVGSEIPDVRLNFFLQHREPVCRGESFAAHNWRIARSRFTLPVCMPAPDLTAFGRDDSNAIVIHAGASREYQRWPVQRYIDLANQLARTYPVRWISQGNEKVNLSQAVEQVHTATLDDLVRVIAGARLFVGNNSGPMHIASALGVPGVILMGPSSLRWDPVWHRDRFTILREPRIRCQPCDLETKPVNRCTNEQTPMACLTRWGVDAVYTHVVRMMDSFF